MKKFGNAPVWTFIAIGVILFVYGMGSVGVANKAKFDACQNQGGTIVQGKCVVEVKM